MVRHWITADGHANFSFLYIITRSRDIQYINHVNYARRLCGDSVLFLGRILASQPNYSLIHLMYGGTCLYLNISIPTVYKCLFFEVMMQNIPGNTLFAVVVQNKDFTYIYCTNMVPYKGLHMGSLRHNILTLYVSKCANIDNFTDDGV